MWSVIKRHSEKNTIVVQTRCKVTAFAIYDKEASALCIGQALEVWHDGKLVSRCQATEKDLVASNE